MRKTVVPYQLIRVKSGKVVFEAAYVKYYPGANYCAMFERYPSSQTKVLICRKVEPNEDQYGFRLCKLVSRGQDNSENQIGFYVQESTVASEKEANERLEQNMKGVTAIAQALGGRKT